MGATGNDLIACSSQGVSGRILLGVNLELYGLPLNQSVHAEQFVIANAVRVGERRLTRLAVSAEPCGHCRQVGRPPP